MKAKIEMPRLSGRRLFRDIAVHVYGRVAHAAASLRASCRIEVVTVTKAALGGVVNFDGEYQDRRCPAEGSVLQRDRQFL